MKRGRFEVKRGEVTISPLPNADNPRAAASTVVKQVNVFENGHCTVDLKKYSARELEVGQSVVITEPQSARELSLLFALVAHEMARNRDAFNTRRAEEVPLLRINWPKDESPDGA